MSEESKERTPRRGLLSGVRVVELAHPLTEYAGLNWAALGAEVWLVEPPQGAATRRRRPQLPHVSDSMRASAAFLARNGGKKSVVVDPRSAEDRQLLRALCERADVLFSADGTPYTELPQPPVSVRVTDRLGLGVSSIVGFAASGGMASSGWPHQPPCNAPSWLALDGAGMYAAVMAAVGLLATRRAGRQRVLRDSIRGSGRCVDHAVDALPAFLRDASRGAGHAQRSARPGGLSHLRGQGWLRAHSCRHAEAVAGLRAASWRA